LLAEISIAIDSNDLGAHNPLAILLLGLDSAKYQEL
jgi:hypothetical protein